jgi:homoserine dehydrogenase
MLANVSGVYNAVEVIGQPIGNVLFYGQGAGAGATASAVVADLVSAIKQKRHYAIPTFKAAKESFPDGVGGFVSRHMFVYKAKYKEKVLEVFKDIVYERNGKIAVITEPMTEAAAGNVCDRLLFNGVFHYSHIRVLD